MHHRQRAQRWPLSAFADVPLVELVAVRAPSNTHHQPQRPSWYWMASTDEHVSTRTRIAEAHLRELDFDPAIIAIRAEPFVLHANERTLKGQTPDFLALRRDGSRLVIDIVTPRRAVHQTVRQYLALMTHACQRLGWEHRVLAMPDPVRRSNLAWLAGFRRPATDEPQVAEALLAAAAEPVALSALATAVGAAWQTRPVLFHLLWTGDLVCDLAKPLNDDRLVRRAA